MAPNWKQIGVIALIAAAAIMFGFFIYWFFWRPLIGPTETAIAPASPSSQLATSPQAGTRTSTVSTATAPGLTAAERLQQQISANPASGLAPARSSQAIVTSTALYSSSVANGISYYSQQDKKFYRLDASGKALPLSDQEFYNVSNAVFAPTGDKAVIEYPNGSKIVYDFANGKQYTLPSHWQDFSFSATGDKIIFKNMGLDTENRYLVAAKYDGSGAKIIEAVGDNAYKVAANWSPNNQIVATYAETKDASRSEIFFIGQNNENFKSMVVEGQGFEGIWSPTGNTILYSVYSPAADYKPQLWISSASGDNIGGYRQKIALQTWASDCAYAGESVAICSVSRNLASGAGLAKDYASASSQDDIYAVNLATGQTAFVATPSAVVNIGKIMVNPGDGNGIYYTDKYTNQIYRVNLNQ